VVEPGAVVGARTAVWHHAHVRTGAVVGADCVLGQNSFVDAGVTVGDRVKLENNASVHAGATLADEVFLGPGAVITNDRRPRARNDDFEPTPTRVERGASIGANATVVCGCDLGEYAMVGAGAVVTRPVPAHALVVGNPARPVGWVCRCGDVVSRAPQRPASVVCERCS
jgi:acetyltransferase-like isoleucine patch superfamily enzyme